MEANLTPNIVDIEHLAKFMRMMKASDGNGRARRGAMFWTGAGCSVSAGFPTAYEVSKGLLPRICRAYHIDVKDGHYSDHECLELFERIRAREKKLENKTLGTSYSVLMELLQSEKLQRDAIKEILLEVDLGQINWTHIYLAQLVKRDFVHTILTTNFDLLALRGLMYSRLTPVIYDGFEGHNRILPKAACIYPQLIHVHGSMHSYRLRNTRPQMATVKSDNEISRVLRQLIRDSDVLVVVGYGGNDDEGLMQALIHESEINPDTHFYWVSYTSHFSELSKGVQDFLTSPVGDRYWIPGQDSDSFFHNLCLRMEVGSPEWISNPVAAALESINSIKMSTRTEEILQRRVSHTIEGLSSLMPKQADRIGDLLELEMKGPYEIWNKLQERDLHDIKCLIECKQRMYSAFELARTCSPNPYMQTAISDCRYLVENVEFRKNPLDLFDAIYLRAKTYTNLAELSSLGDGNKYLDMAKDDLDELIRLDIDCGKQNSNKLKHLFATNISVKGRLNKDVKKIDEASDLLAELLEIGGLEDVQEIAVVTNLANNRRNVADISGDIPSLRHAIVLYMEIERKVRDDARHLINLPKILSNIGNAFKVEFFATNDLSCLGKAEKYAREAYGLRSTSRHVEVGAWLIGCVNLGVISFLIGRFKESEDALIESTQLLWNCINHIEIESFYKVKIEAIRYMICGINDLSTREHPRLSSEYSNWRLVGAKELIEHHRNQPIQLNGVHLGAEMKIKLEALKIAESWTTFPNTDDFE